MSFPAYETLSRDIDLGFARWKVYMRLVHGGVLNHATPAEVKAESLAEGIVWRNRRGRSVRLSPRKVRDALDWLVDRGYLVEHGRDPRGVRLLTLCWAMADVASKPPASEESRTRQGEIPFRFPPTVQK